MLTWKKKIAVIAATACFSICSIMSFAGSTTQYGNTSTGFATKAKLTATYGSTCYATATLGCEQTAGSTIYTSVTARILDSSGNYVSIKSKNGERTPISDLNAEVIAVQVEASASSYNSYRSTSSHGVNGDMGYWSTSLARTF